MFTSDQLRDILQSESQSKHFIIAYSGGLDSHVLLHAMYQLRRENPAIHFEAVHINHQLNSAADQWTAHCQSICDQLNIILHIEKINISLKPGDSLEEQARVARYEALKKCIDKNSGLLTAHTVNDQAETFLLQALRGSGLKGLSAMPVKKNFGNGVLIRPLLTFSREQLEQYAKQHQLQWIEDDSNRDMRFDRNFLRHHIFPLLKQRWPRLDDNFARSARMAAESEQVIVENTKTFFEIIKTDDVQKIKYKPLRDFPDKEQRLLLRYWLHENHCRMPHEKQLKQIQKDVLNASSDAKPRFVLGDGDAEILRDRECLIFKTSHNDRATQ